MSFCLYCGIIYKAKFFDEKEIALIYDRVYYEIEKEIKNFPSFIYDDNQFKDKMALRTYELIKHVETINNTKRIKKIFDIGGRDGFRLKLLANDGYECTVYDPIKCESFDEKILKKNVWSYQIPEKEKADLIICCSVLEHIIEPHGIIQDCYKCLQQKGFLIVEVPFDIELFFDWIFFGMIFGRNLGVDNTHFIYYSVKSLKYLLEINGFKVIESHYYQHSGLTPQIEIIGQKCDINYNHIKLKPSYNFGLLKSGYMMRLLNKAYKKLKF